MDSLIFLVISGVLAFGAANIAVNFFAKIAARFGVVDRPGVRKTHESATPLLGGLAIMSSVFLLLLLPDISLELDRMTVPNDLTRILEDFSLVEIGRNVEFIGIAAGAVLMGVTGLIDDVLESGVPAWAKLFIQIFCAAGVVLAGLTAPVFNNSMLDAVLTIIWIVGVTNAFNLLDNMDGLSSSIALVASGFLFYFSLALSQHWLAFFWIVFIGGVFGFFRQNFFKAKIFMGDSGSLFIGFIIATVSIFLTALLLEDGVAGKMTLLTPILVLAVPIYDTFSVIIIRLREGRSVFVGDQSHISHRLVALGFSRRNAVLVIGAAAIFSGALSVFVFHNKIWAALTLGGVGALLGVLWLKFIKPGF